MIGGIKLANLVDKIYAELDEEGMQKVRWQEKMRLVIFLLQLVAPIAYVLLWITTRWSHTLARWSQEEPLLFSFVFFGGELLFALPISYLNGWIELRLGTNREPLGNWAYFWFRWAFHMALLNMALFSFVFDIYASSPGISLFANLVLAFAFNLLIFWLQSPALRKRFKVEPIEDHELKARIGAVFEKAGVPFKNIYLLHAGPKTTRGNALVIPKALGYEVLLYDNLVEALDPGALAFVTAHELVHIKNEDLPRRLIANSTLLFFSLFIGQVTVRTLAPWFWLDPLSVEALPLFYLGTTLTYTIGQVLLNALRRWHEYAADRYAFELTGDLDTFEQAFTVLAKRNFLDPDPPRWLELLLHSHPSIKHRWEAGQRYFEKKS